MITAESVNDSFPLTDFLHEDELRIGEPLSSACNDYDEKYYIDRTFNHNIFIRQNILNDERGEKFDDLLDIPEQEFKQLCQQNSHSNVHWLEKDKSEELLKQKTRRKNLKIWGTRLASIEEEFKGIT